MREKAPFVAFADFHVVNTLPWLMSLDSELGRHAQWHTTIQLFHHIDTLGADDYKSIESSKM